MKVLLAVLFSLASMAFCQFPGNVQLSHKTGCKNFDSIVIKDYTWFKTLNECKRKCNMRSDCKGIVFGRGYWNSHKDTGDCDLLGAKCIPNNDDDDHTYEKPDCYDINNQCDLWKHQCFVEWVKRDCKKTCGFCNDPTTAPPPTTAPVCKDHSDLCKYDWMSCDASDYNRKTCAKKCGTCGGGGATNAPTTLPPTTACKDLSTMCKNDWMRCDASDYNRQTCPKKCGLCGGGNTQPPPTTSAPTTIPPTTASTECKDLSPMCPYLNCADAYTQTACKVKCNLCPTSGPSTAAPVTQACTDAWGASYCSGVKKWCSSASTYANCQKTCGACGPTTQPPPSTQEPPSTQAPPSTLPPTDGLSTIPPSTLPPTSAPTTGPCLDSDEGFCKANAGFWACYKNDTVKAMCPKSCFVCYKPTYPPTTPDPYPWCQDKVSNCRGQLSMCKDSYFFRENCKRSCGLCPKRTTPPPPNATTPAPITAGPAGSCGKRQVQVSSIVAGDDAMEGAWPWQIVMYLMDAQHCGGSIISDRWIVSAAHCVYKNSWQPHLFKIRVGDHDTSSKSNHEVEIGVEKIIMHPDWSDNTFAGDIALLKLKTPITFGTYVQPICLSDQEPVAGRRCMITGWGRTGGDQPPAKILQQAELPIVDRNTCYNYNRKDVPIAITQQMICAGYPGTSARMGCKGDSGGPLVCQDSNNFWQLVGAVSFGSANCDSKQAYTVFANVAGYKSWIHDTMRYN